MAPTRWPTTPRPAEVYAHGFVLERVGQRRGHHRRSRARGSAIAGIVINPVHHPLRLAIHDALAACRARRRAPPVQPRRPRAVAAHPVAPVATGTISGFGGAGYTLAVAALAGLVGPPS
jgi:3-dehydroquinate dehydratase